MDVKRRKVYERIILVKREEIEEMSKQELIEYLKMITDRISPLYVEFKYEKEMIKIVEYQLPQNDEQDLTELCSDVISAFKKYSELLQVICTRIYELQEVENSKQKRPFIIDYELWYPEDDINDTFEDDGLPF